MVLHDKQFPSHYASRLFTRNTLRFALSSCPRTPSSSVTHGYVDTTHLYHGHARTSYNGLLIVMLTVSVMPSRYPAFPLTHKGLKSRFSQNTCGLYRPAGCLQQNQSSYPYTDLGSVQLTYYRTMLRPGAKHTPSPYQNLKPWRIIHRGGFGLRIYPALHISSSSRVFFMLKAHSLPWTKCGDHQVPLPITTSTGGT